MCQNITDCASPHSGTMTQKQLFKKKSQLLLTCRFNYRVPLSTYALTDGREISLKRANEIVVKKMLKKLRDQQSHINYTYSQSIKYYYRLPDLKAVLRPPHLHHTPLVKNYTWQWRCNRIVHDRNLSDLLFSLHWDSDPQVRRRCFWTEREKQRESEETVIIKVSEREKEPELEWFRASPRQTQRL